MSNVSRSGADRPARALLPSLLLVSLVASVLLGAGLAVLPVLSTPALAVTPVASEPRERQKLSDPPGAVTLAFSREVDPSVAKLVVLGPDGKNVTSGTLIIEGTNVTSQLRTDLDRGTYTVHYRIDGRDGQPEGGAYQFSYGSGSFTDLPDTSWSGDADEPEVLRGTNPNGSEQPDAPSTAAGTPGIEVTSKATSSAPPPPTEAPPTVKAPPGPATDDPTEEPTDEPTGATTEESATPAAEPGSSGAPWIIGGVLLLLAVGGTAAGLWQRNKKAGAPEHD